MVDSHGKTGFKGYLDAQVVSLLGEKDLASIRGKENSTCWRIHDNITSIQIYENITHYVVFLVQHQPFSLSYFNDCSQL